MIVSSITDRLGNQMFQYAAAKALAVRKNTIAKIDKRYYERKRPKGYEYELGVFCLPQDFVNEKEIKEYTGLSNLVIHRGIRRVYPKHQKNNPHFFYYERFFEYDEKINELGDKVYLSGYWQSYKYFDDCREIIRKDFSFRNKIDYGTDEFAQKILSTNSVCISVRRGDIVTHPELYKKYGQCDMNYYNKALEILSQAESDLHLFVFSDDIDWCLNNMHFKWPVFFVKKDSSMPGPYYSLQLISLCKHFIIPVSTFHWWGAWLSTNEQKTVIAPELWFTDSSINTKDLCPPEWIRI